MLRNLAVMAPSTAASRSASANTRNGALPPSSIDVRRTVCAAWASRTLPTAVEQNLSEKQGCEGSVRCRLDHRRAACCEGGRNLPCGHGQREVPRGDEVRR